MVSVSEVKKLKAQELRDELQKLGLDITGLKPALTARLEEALTKSTTEDSAATNAPEPSTSAPEAPKTQTAPVALTNGKVAISFSAPGKKSEEAEKTGPSQNTGDEPAASAPAVVSEAEKRKQRAERFGVPPSLDEKKAARAERFGLDQKAAKPATATNGISQLSESDKAALDEKKKERAKRFNLPVSITKEELERQKKARLERFGSGTSNGAASAKASPEDSAALQAKLAARAERFALAGKGTSNGKTEEAAKPVEVKKVLDPEAEAKRKAREIKFTPK